MKEKGFTLIELLAVIVILAIIALIAVPIILNIINTSREQARKRSAELYEKAVLNAILKEQMDGTTIVPDGEYTVQEDGSICIIVNGSCKEGSTIPVEVEGERPAVESTITIENGKVTCYHLEISGGDPIEKGTCSGSGAQEKYGYMWYTGSYVAGPSIEGDGSNLETTLPLDKTYYLKYKLDDSNKVTNAYACAIFGEEEYCLEGGSADTYYGWDTDAAHSTGNVKVLYDIQSANITGVSCNFSSSFSNCSGGSVYFGANSSGDVSANAGGVYCSVSSEGGSNCLSL